MKFFYNIFGALFIVAGWLVFFDVLEPSPDAVAMAAAFAFAEVNFVKARHQDTNHG